MEQKHESLMRECIVVGGKASGGHVLGKTRDRNYIPRLQVIRDITKDGLEIVYIHDLDTGYAEGMNSEGIGVVNAALLIGEDEKAVKGKISSNDGPRLYRALQQTTLRNAIQSLVSWKDGIKGHTLVGSPKSLYSIELTSKNNPVIKKLNTKTGFDVRTNHGEDHKDAGYTPERRPEDYLSSKVRKATAEMELANVQDHEEMMPALAQQNFKKDSNYNMKRTTNKMRSTNQVMMHLDDLEFLCYLFPEECKFKGVIDKTPDGYEPKIKIKVIEYT